MRKIVQLSFVLLLTALRGISQKYSVGHRTVTFNDPTRTGGYGSSGGPGRQIQTEVYYPSTAASAGDSTAFAPGQYPILVFGHGFVMDYSSYDNFWNDLVPQGYIMCFPRTEGSISPSHTDFGKDLALIPSRMLTLNTSTASPFYNTMISKIAIMGHSMGGGSSFLACDSNTIPTTMVTFAAANTTPSAIIAAKYITIPTLVLAGTNDCIAPPPANQDSMYLQCAASCKAEITIKGACHYGFADYSTECSFGQITCSPAPTITSAQQWATASAFYSPWLKYWLKGNCTSWNLFLDSTANDTNVLSKISCGLNCSTTGINNLLNNNIVSIYPNPSNGSFVIESNNSAKQTMQLFDVNGKLVLSQVISGTTTIDASNLSDGVYNLKVSAADRVVNKRVVIAR